MSIPVSECPSLWKQSVAYGWNFLGALFWYFSRLNPTEDKATHFVVDTVTVDTALVEILSILRSTRLLSISNVIIEIMCAYVHSKWQVC